MEKEKEKKETSNDVAALIMIAAITIFALLGLGLVFNNLFFQEEITSYEECEKADGSIIQESYPPVCETKDGVRFTKTIIPDDNSNYTCPESEYVNCMPVINDPARQEMCTPEYLQWAQENCPNFKGAAY